MMRKASTFALSSAWAGALVLVLAGSTAIAACTSGGSDVEDPASVTDPKHPGEDGGDVATPGPIPDGPDVPPVAFPTAVPLLFGYGLVDAFPGTFLSGAMDIAWPAGSNEPFVLQRGGDIVRLAGGGARTVVLDFEGEVAQRGEAGALGMALHPKFADAGDPHPYVYLWLNAEGSPTHQRLVRYSWNAGAGVFDAGSRLVLVDQAEGTTQHNGAHLRFGPDGFLYFANGDDTRTDETTQRLDAGLFSGLFRIDVDSRGGAVSHPPPRTPTNASTQGYFIPNDNPFVGIPGANEEYFALGFRNPYSFNFDRLNGDLWLADVGDTFREEVNHVFAGSNYGWPFFEGTKRRRDGSPSIGTLRAPTYEYAHAAIGDLVSTMGGYVYRGAAMPELAGRFIFSDWPTGRVWALDTAAGKRRSLVESNQDDPPVGFGQDAAGEIHLVAWSKILKVVRAPGPSGVPAKLSATGIFRNTQTLKLPSALVPYEVRSPLWSDGAAKQRWVYVPAGKTSTMDDKGTFALPVGSMIVKQFDLPEAARPTGGRAKRLETRVLVVGKDATYGVTYRWNAQGTDADLVVEAAEESIGDQVPSEARQWHFPSSGECWSCHRAENRVLGFRGEQLNFTLANGENQLAALVAKGVLDPASLAQAPPPIPNPADTSAPIEDRAMAYLAANCAPCHHANASYLGSDETWKAEPGVAIGNRGLVNAPHHNDPMASAFGLPQAPLVAPGDANGSILFQRVKSTDPDLRMPPLLRTLQDPVGASVLAAWINSL